MRDYRELLDIVNENDEVIRQDTRENIHKLGLLHREVHVWIYNDNDEMLFQKRAEDKETFPGLLDASVGGHVEKGQTYEEAAIMELAEETGIQASPSELKFITKTRNDSHDSLTGKVNNTHRMNYAYKFTGKKGDLKVEDGKATSLEFWPFETIFNIADDDKVKFIPIMFEESILEIFKKVRELNKN